VRVMASCRPSPCEVQLALGRINPLNLSWCTSFDEQFGESAVATTDIHPLQPAGQHQPVNKKHTRQPTPVSHHLLVRRPIVEADLILADRYSAFKAVQKNNARGTFPKLQRRSNYQTSGDAIPSIASVSIG
jgi:hypothetical protein